MHTHTRTHTAMCDWQVIVAEHTYTEILRRHAKHGSRSRRTKKTNQRLSHICLCLQNHFVLNLCLYVVFSSSSFKGIVHCYLFNLMLYQTHIIFIFPYSESCGQASSSSACQAPKMTKHYKNIMTYALYFKFSQTK